MAEQGDKGATGRAAAALLDGNARAAAIRAELAERIAERKSAGRRAPGLAAVLVGDDPASKIYVGRKQRQAGEVGIASKSLELPADTSLERLLDVIARLDAAPEIDGILLQLPLPAGLDARRAIAAVDPARDVDGLHPENQGALLAGQPGLRPCTPAACMDLLEHAGVELEGRRAVVIGRSLLVGKPVALMLLERNATVVLCHSRTRDLAREVAEADVVVAAAGSPGLVRGEWIRPGATVLDVGIHRVEGGLVGDVDFEGAARRAAYITPVPGGVGPMTVALLLRNTFDAMLRREGAAGSFS